MQARQVHIRQGSCAKHSYWFNSTHPREGLRKRCYHGAGDACSISFWDTETQGLEVRGVQAVKENNQGIVTQDGHLTTHKRRNGVGFKKGTIFEESESLFIISHHLNE